MNGVTKHLNGWPIEKKIMAGFGLALATLAVVGMVQYRSIQLLIETDGWVAHTHTVLTELEATYSDLQRAESGTRGYIATGQEDYLRLQEPGIARSQEHFGTLRSLISDDPRQQQNLDRLALLIESKIAVMQHLVAMRRDRGLAAATQELSKGEGLQLMSEIRTLVDAMEAKENGLLVARQAASRAGTRNADVVIALGTMLALAFVLAAGWITRHDSLHRRRAEQELRRLNRALRTLSECGQVAARALNESQLLRETCSILAKEGGYLLAWVGFAEHDEAKSVRPAAFAGVEAGYLETLKISWADTERGRGPTGTAIRTGETIIARSLSEDPAFAPWRDEALRRGYASSISLPLVLEGQPRGALMLYSQSPDSFDAEEVQLLTQLANDLAFGIQAFRGRADRLRSQEALHRANAYNRSLIEASVDPLVTIAPDGKVTDVNNATEKATGFSRQELIGTDFSDYFTDPARARAGYQQVFREGWVQDYELEVRHRKGHTTPVLYNASVYNDDSGKVIGVFAAARDISARKRAEGDLRESKRRLDLAQKAGRLGSWEWIIASEVVIFTPEMEAIYGFAPGGLEGKYANWRRSVHPDDLERVENDLRLAVESGKDYESEFRIVWPDGSIRWMAARGALIHNGEAQPSRMVGINVDITERKRAEDEVRKLNAELEQRVAHRTAELEATNKELEAFTYSVSHDLRAPLRHIDGFARMLVDEENAGLSQEGRRYLGRIQEGTRQMGHLVDDLLNLTRLGRKEMSLQATGLSSLAREAVEEIKKENTGRAIEWKIEPLPFVECDPGLMKQVFVNLLSNAVKFTRTRPQARIEVGAKTEDGQPVIFVRDNGVGFSMKYADKLFGVFQRLHRTEDFEGTGIGLATVQRILHRHGGRAWAEGQLDKGATFYFTLGAEKPEGSRQQAAGSPQKAA